MNVGALLLLGTDPGRRAAEVRDVLTERVARIPRLHHRLARAPLGLGGPYWVQDDGFDLDRHVTVVTCAEPGREALLAAAAATVTRPFGTSHPLWRAAVLTGGDGTARGLVVVLHHVLADGLGALSMLGALVDGDPVPGPGSGGALLPPRRRDLLADRMAHLGGAALAVRRLPAVLRRGRVELGSGPRERAPRCSLNAVTGPSRHLSTADVEVGPLLAGVRGHGATINDALLVAVTGAMSQVLDARGERVAELVVSVPVSARASSGAGPGNHVGVMAVRVRLHGTTSQRLRAVAATTGARRQAPGASAALIGPAFRLLVRVGIFRRFIERQGLVNSFLTNMRGPESPVSIAGVPVVEVVPITTTPGNVGVAFAALSYAGTLTVTVVADPAVVPEVDALAAHIGSELRRACAVAADSAG